MPPTRDQQVAQIETLLRQRFFDLVPKDGAGDWTVEQEPNRLSRSLAAYGIGRLCGLDDVSAAASVTDGGNDGGIDAAHYDRANARLMLVQAEFRRNGGAPSQHKVLATINGVRALRAKRFEQFNPRFQDRIDQIEEALDTPGVTITIAFIYLGDALGEHAARDLATYQAESNGASEVVRGEDCGCARVHGWLDQEQAPGSVTLRVTLCLWKCVTAPRKAIYGQITAATLAELARQHGKALFERNIRHYLGSYGVNAAIAETVRATPGDLFYLNNGITIVAERVTPAAGTEADCAFDLVNASIVNGAQTAGSILTASQTGEISPDAKLLVTIIEIGEAADELGVRITKARNHQNIVRGIDFAALDPTQERLRRELAAAGFRYRYRPSEEARIPSVRSITVEEAAVALACLSCTPMTRADVDLCRTHGQACRNAIDLVVAAKKQVSHLWDQSGPVYPQLFSDNITGVRLCRIVSIYRMLNGILAGSEQSSLGYFKRMFYRHGRYFIMAFVAQRCASVLNRVAYDLTDAECAELSRATNELSELIYVASEDRQGEKGYLAIFRNLTDAQPLADKVLRRLAAPAAVAAGIVNAAPAAPAVAEPPDPDPPRPQQDGPAS